VCVRERKMVAGDCGGPRVDVVCVFVCVTFWRELLQNVHAQHIYTQTYITYGEHARARELTKRGIFWREQILHTHTNTRTQVWREHAHAHELTGRASLWRERLLHIHK